MDPRIRQLAKNLTAYSVALQKNDNVLLDISGHDALPLAEALLEESYARGANPYLHLSEPRLTRAYLTGAAEEQMRQLAEFELTRMKKMDAYIAVRAGDNSAELADVDQEQLARYAKAMSPVLRDRVDRSRWVILRYPNGAMAQSANMSSAAFEDFYFKVCNLDYGKLSQAMDALVDRMNATDDVHLLAPGTDLHFSIKGINAVKCAGECNIPDGEVYTAPVKDSANGVIRYNVPSRYRGTTFENVSLTFKDGRIIDAQGNHPDRLAAIFDTDEGARYLGEFALGCNPFILNPMSDILFDEKIAGSIHLTPGAAYEDAFNGNKSDVHWDLVLIMRPEWGGGEIYFDGECIRRDGLFLPEDLQALNPDAFIEKE
ncbi:aminopeptidase [Peptococcus niger]|uniref:Leucyl aminopeptidase (Aminopeptidase T) n=1 Tax=Peptococcus niger TaxID=2741 RepID=A0A1G6ZBK5_PEPNI|nr:aminopeptidase [Peptococcus niger]SDD99998.1 Leucyl aminopeptidase (aminopeptidase T) [Peptococcus niger]